MVRQACSRLACAALSNSPVHWVRTTAGGGVVQRGGGGGGGGGGCFFFWWAVMFWGRAVRSAVGARKGKGVGW